MLCESVFSTIVPQGTTLVNNRRERREETLTEDFPTAIPERFIYTKHTRTVYRLTIKPQYSTVLRSIAERKLFEIYTNTNAAENPTAHQNGAAQNPKNDELGGLIFGALSAGILQSARIIFGAFSDGADGNIITPRR